MNNINYFAKNIKYVYNWKNFLKMIFYSINHTLKMFFEKNSNSKTNLKVLFDMNVIQMNHHTIIYIMICTFNASMKMYTICAKTHELFL